MEQGLEGGQTLRGCGVWADHAQGLQALGGCLGAQAGGTGACKMSSRACLARVASVAMSPGSVLVSKCSTGFSPAPVATSV